MFGRQEMVENTMIPVQLMAICPASTQFPLGQQLVMVPKVIMMKSALEKWQWHLLTIPMGTCAMLYVVVFSVTYSFPLGFLVTNYESKPTASLELGMISSECVKHLFLISSPYRLPQLSTAVVSIILVGPVQPAP